MSAIQDCSYHCCRAELLERLREIAEEIALAEERELAIIAENLHLARKHGYAYTHPRTGVTYFPAHKGE